MLQSVWQALFFLGLQLGRCGGMGRQQSTSRSENQLMGREFRCKEKPTAITYDRQRDRNEGFRSLTHCRSEEAAASAAS